MIQNTSFGYVASTLRTCFALEGEQMSFADEEIAYLKSQSWRA
ncbi:hypothetical protein RHOER0001_2704 [Rhodococcus erythropolis SK121]|nr:hypothetical protein RHOER0001_2704 [Rhodococcus erythropolis SK121]